MNNKIIDVVGMAILNESNQILMAQRPSHKTLPNKWEFAGGKIEQNETPEECIIREIKEELNLDVNPINYLGVETFEYEHALVKLHLFTGIIISDAKLTLNEHQKVAWVSLENLGEYDLPPVDIPFIPKLKKLLGE